MSQGFSRLVAVFMLVLCASAMLAVSFEAEARRMGGARSFGRQSSNIMKQRQAVTPPKTSATPVAAAGSVVAKSSRSRWLGPLTGIAAGLGIAALLSHLGLSGAFLEMMSSLVLIGLIAAAIVFLVRRLRGAAAPAVLQRAGPADPGRSGGHPAAMSNAWRQFSPASGAGAPAPAEAVPAPPVDPSWFIPNDFDIPTFLAQAKTQFVAIQAIWDSGDQQKLHEWLTHDLIAEITPQLLAREAPAETEIVLLNAELLGIETVSGGHLASVRYSGMLRENKDAEAFRFEEVWNLYKAKDAGWLLAGIQQIPTDYAS